MATSKTTHSVPASGRSARSRRQRTADPSPAAANCTAEDPPERWVEHLRQLSILVPRLRAIYGTTITAELALRQQAAEQDPEVADCLRVGVCDPIADQVQALEGIVERFRRAATGSKQ